MPDTVDITPVSSYRDLVGFDSRTLEMLNPVYDHRTLEPSQRISFLGMIRSDDNCTVYFVNVQSAVQRCFIVDVLDPDGADRLLELKNTLADITVTVTRYIGATHQGNIYTVGPAVRIASLRCNPQDNEISQLPDFTPIQIRGSITSIDVSPVFPRNKTHKNIVSGSISVRTEAGNIITFKDGIPRYNASSIDTAHGISVKIGDKVHVIARRIGNQMTGGYPVFPLRTNHEQQTVNDARQSIAVIIQQLLMLEQQRKFKNIRLLFGQAMLQKPTCQEYQMLRSVIDRLPQGRQPAVTCYVPMALKFRQLFNVTIYSQTKTELIGFITELLTFTNTHQINCNYSQDEADELCQDLFALLYVVIPNSSQLANLIGRCGMQYAANKPNLDFPQLPFVQTICKMLVATGCKAAITWLVRIIDHCIARHNGCLNNCRRYDRWRNVLNEAIICLRMLFASFPKQGIQLQPTVDRWKKELRYACAGDVCKQLECLKPFQ